MNSLHRLHDLGQAVWLDSIRRSYLDEGGYLDGLVEAREISGLTSNPTIFAKALASDERYADQLRELAGADPADAFWALAKRDVRDACDRFLPLWERTDGQHGHVSIEVDPSVAFDAERTISDALLLAAELDRPNLMVKVPGTESGLEAITRLLGEGVSVNVTLLFSVARYEAVIDAFLAGLTRRMASGGDVSGLASVASFFVSRVDTKVDAQLAPDHHLRATAAIANARAAYGAFTRRFAGPEFAALAAEGARVQRPLWASTSAKDPSLPPTYYVDALAGPDTVTTVPETTLDAVRADGDPADRLSGSEEAAARTLDALRGEGVDLDRITAELESEGVQAFVASFDEAVATVDGALTRT